MNLSLSIIRFRLSTALVAIFVLVYFIDAANLNDLVPGTVVLHPDANESGEYVAESTSGGPAYSHSLDQSLTKPVHHQGKTIDLRMVIDQDSPSVAPESLVSLHAADVLMDNERRFLDSYRDCLPRYLLNCSLLI